MIRLTRQQQSSTQTVIRIDGTLSGETLGELETLIGPDFRGTLILDLSGLTSLDPEGRAFLAHVRKSGHQLRGGSLYINRLLEEAQP